MGVFARRDSPVWWLYLETTHQKERTEIRVGTTVTQRRESRRLAEDRYHQRMNELAARLYKLPVTPTAIRFDAFARWYDAHVIAHHRGASREREILKVLVAAFGPRPLTEITLAAVQEWRTRRLQAVRASTVNREVDLLKTLLKAAVPTYLPTFPLVGLTRVRPERRETFVLSRQDERRLLAAASAADRALILCAIDTLMRLSDVLHLRRDQDRGSYLVVTDPKIAPYTVPVSARLRKALDGLPKTGPYYFPHRRHAKLARDQRGSVQGMLEAVCKAAGVPYGRERGGLTFHALRHTGATRLAEAGVSMRIIQEIGGWRSLRQLERYAHPSDQAKRDAVNRIGSSRRRRAG